MAGFKDRACISGKLPCVLSATRANLCVLERAAVLTDAHTTTLIAPVVHRDLNHSTFSPYKRAVIYNPAPTLITHRLVTTSGAGNQLINVATAIKKAAYTATVHGIVKAGVVKKTVGFAEVVRA